MDFDALKPMILEKLAKELPESLQYHNVDHTVEVIAESERIGLAMGVAAEDLQLIKTAALLHDVGYIQGRTNHELNSVAFAKETLPKWGYTSVQIEVICDMIMATKIPQSSKNDLEKILCDADLSYLGTDAFQAKGDKLFHEFLSDGFVSSKKGWDKMQIEFLREHSYFTEVAQTTYGPKKAENLQRLIQQQGE